MNKWEIKKDIMKGQILPYFEKWSKTFEKIKVQFARKW